MNPGALRVFLIRFVFSKALFVCRDVCSIRSFVWLVLDFDVLGGSLTRKGFGKEVFLAIHVISYPHSIRIPVGRLPPPLSSPSLTRLTSSTPFPLFINSFPSLSPHILLCARQALIHFGSLSYESV